MAPVSGDGSRLWGIECGRGVGAYREAGGDGGVSPPDDVAVRAWSRVSLWSREGGNSVSGGWRSFNGRCIPVGGVPDGDAAVAARVGKAASLPGPRVWALGGISGVSNEAGVVVLTVDLGGTGDVWHPGDGWAAAHVGQAAPLPAPRVGVMGPISRVSSEGGVSVLTVELEGDGRRPTPW